MKLGDDEDGRGRGERLLQRRGQLRDGDVGEGEVEHRRADDQQHERQLARDEGAELGGRNGDEAPRGWWTEARVGDARRVQPRGGRVDRPAREETLGEQTATSSSTTPTSTSRARADGEDQQGGSGAPAHLRRAFAGLAATSATRDVRPLAAGRRRRSARGCGRSVSSSAASRRRQQVEVGLEADAEDRRGEGEAMTCGMLIDAGLYEMKVEISCRSVAIAAHETGPYLERDDGKTCPTPSRAR